MKTRLLLVLSLLANVFLIVALSGVGRQNVNSGTIEKAAVSPPEIPDYGTNVMGMDGQRVPVFFHWSVIEARDYRLYIANLRPSVARRKPSGTLSSRR